MRLRKDWLLDLGGLDFWVNKVWMLVVRSRGLVEVVEMGAVRGCTCTASCSQRSCLELSGISGAVSVGRKLWLTWWLNPKG